MNEKTPVSTDLLAIKAICIIGLINATQMVNLVFSPITKQIGALVPTYFIFSVLISLVCLLGLWFLKKWAAVAYAIVLVANQGVLIRMGFWEATASIMPVIIIFLLYKFRGKLIK